MAGSSTRRGDLVWLGYVMVVASASFAAGNGVFASLVIHAGVDPATLSATRIYGAAAILVFFLLPHLRTLRRGHLLPLAAFGVVGLVLGQGAYFQAISHADVALVLVIIFTAPIVVAVYERVRLGATLPLHGWAAIVVAVGGVGLAIVGEGGMPAISLTGFLFALVAMIAYAWSVILAAGLPRALPPLARTGACMVVAAIVWCFVRPPWSLPFDKLDDTTTFDGRFGFSLPVWVAVVFVILIGSVGVYVTWVGGTSLTGAGASSMVGMVEPVLGAVLAWGLLGQHLVPTQVVGIAIAVGGIVVVERARVRAARATPRDAPVEL
ncbi:MAG: EamA family transporter [Gaiellales bacterium]